MNMVGHRGKGVSAWLSMATVHALNCWSQICAETGRDELAGEFERHAASMTDAIQSHFWDGDWFARGITDAGTVFGVSSDGEGRIFLNPQSWAMLAGIASAEQRERMIRAVEAQLEGPYGVEMLAPAYTALRDDVGRLTQKFPGSAENGSVYNHAAAFYVAALFGADRPDHAYRLLRRMIPGPDWEDFLQRGQLPVFIPNYYRGARRQLPRTAGRSSQLFNTGTVSWVYSIVIEDLFGLRGCPQGLRIAPRLPSGWRQAVVRRDFRGARFSIRFRREARVGGTVITVDGKALTGDVIGGIEAGAGYEVDVVLGESRA
jgi:cellobionic acid phosphorylase